jgi:hypothetical protein
VLTKTCKMKVLRGEEIGMCDPEQGDEQQKENTQMNWFVAVALAAGSPLYVLVWMDHHWAEIALKVYLVTAIVFGYILLFSERKYLKERCSGSV